MSLEQDQRDTREFLHTGAYPQLRFKSACMRFDCINRDIEGKCGDGCVRFSNYISKAEMDDKLRYGQEDREVKDD